MDSDQSAALNDDEIKAAFENLRAGVESARKMIFDGNLDWLSRLLAPLIEQSDIPPDDLTAAAHDGLHEAIDKYTNAAFSFRPDDRLQGGFAIWWVRLQISKLALAHGYDYNAAANELTQNAD
jgi:hypothetical protein